MSATCPTRSVFGAFTGWDDRDGPVPWIVRPRGTLLEKVNRLTQAGTEHEQEGVTRRALVTYQRALGLLEAQHQVPKQRPKEWSEAYASLGGGFLRLGQADAAQVAVTRALSLSAAARMLLADTILPDAFLVVALIVLFYIGYGAWLSAHQMPLEA